MSPHPMQAQVALKRPIKNTPDATLSYTIPAHLHDQVQVGQLVWVPLQNQLVQGVIVALTSSPPNGDYTLRAIADIADPAAIITPIGLSLARHVAARTLAPFYDILALMLPPGTSQTATWIWRATPAGLRVDLGSLPTQERGMLYYLRKHGETSEQELRQALLGSKAKLRETWSFLRERGLVVDGVERSRPQVKPRMEHTVRLCIAPTALPATLDKLSRSRKQQAVVAWLAEQTSADGEDTAQPIPVGKLYAETGASLAVLRALATKGIVALDSREVWRNPLVGEYVPPDMPPPLTAGQRHVWEYLAQALDRLFPPTSSLSDDDTGKTVSPIPHDYPHQERVFLLHGVTGSGKTEVYMRAVARVLRRGLQALILVPEIALTTQLVRRFAARFPDQLAVLHSQLSKGERYDEWRRVRQGKARVVIGSRSAVFAPLSTPGVIIIDEEHEPSYKQDDHPRYHARDVALALGELAQCVVILGSATPAVESYYAATHTRHYRLLSMPERVGTVDYGDGLIHSQTLPLPHVKLIDMRRELEQDNRSIFSRPLQVALADALNQGEQAMLFLNRRGAAAFVMCRDCGYVITCPTCRSALVMHYDTRHPKRASEATAELSCHACSHREIVPAFCPKCLSPRIKSFGVGTQRVEQEVVTLFPHARTLRWDRDTATGKGAHSRLLDQFLRHEADVLVGTQMIARGLDLPLVSLVGVVAADTALYLPDFRSGERTFQLLTQVAGRAGRRTSGAKVIIQTYNPEHYALQAAREHDYQLFYKQEMGFRRQAGYPPFGRLVRFLTMNKIYNTAKRAAELLGGKLHALLIKQHLQHWRVIGPAPATLQRLRGRWRWHILLLLPADTPDADRKLATLVAELSPMHGWVIDVDPVHVL